MQCKFEVLIKVRSTDLTPQNYRLTKSNKRLILSQFFSLFLSLRQFLVKKTYSEAHLSVKILVCRSKPVENAVRPESIGTQGLRVQFQVNQIDREFICLNLCGNSQNFLGEFVRFFCKFGP